MGTQTTDHKEQMQELLDEEKQDFFSHPDFTKDIPFQKLMEDPKACEEVIQTFLDRHDFHIVEDQPQQTIEHIDARGVRLDVLCKTDTNEFVNVEMQLSDSVDHARRIRMYSAAIDSEIAEKGTAFSELPDLWVIYITMFDIYKCGRPIYKVKKSIEDIDASYENGKHIIYVNGTIDDGSIYAELMHVLRTGEPNDKFKAVSDRIHHLTKAKGGKVDMLNCYHPEKWEALMTSVRNEGLSLGRDEGKSDTTVFLVGNLMKNSSTGLEDAIRMLGIPEEDQAALRKHFRK